MVSLIKLADRDDVALFVDGELYAAGRIDVGVEDDPDRFSLRIDSLYQEGGMSEPGDFHFFSAPAVFLLQ